MQTSIANQVELFFSFSYSFLYAYSIQFSASLFKFINILNGLIKLQPTNRKVSAMPPKKAPNLKDVYGGIAVYFWVD